MAHPIPKIVYNSITINFDYPPEVDDGENIVPVSRASTSIAGTRQVSTDYLEAVRPLTFSFVSQSLKNTLDTFAQTWALLGKTFDYYDDQTTGSFVTYELKDMQYKTTKIAIKTANTWVWSISITVRRAL